MSSAKFEAVFQTLKNQVDIRIDYPLSKLNTFRVGGSAKLLVKPKNTKELQAALQASKQHDVPYFILGGGSNLLISDLGLEALVIVLKGDFERLHINSDNNRIVVGAAVPFAKLTKMALKAGWRQALGWFGTPGLVGGALKMNAGTRLGEIGDVVESVEVATADGNLTLAHSDIGFEYRNTHFPKGAILLNATLHTPKIDSEKGLQIEAKELLIKRKNSQPKGKTAGSIFKNPPNDFAGRLIEAADLKGTRLGGAQISEVHANFIVNDGTASAQDIFDLATLAQNRVDKLFGVRLQFEVKLIGFS